MPSMKSLSNTRARMSQVLERPLVPDMVFFVLLEWPISSAVKGELYPSSNSRSKIDTRERQMNMDYSLSHVITNSHVGDINNLIIYYDVNCQYHINLPKRLSDSPSLPFPKG